MNIWNIKYDIPHVDPLAVIRRLVKQKEPNAGRKPPALTVTGKQHTTLGSKGKR